MSSGCDHRLVNNAGLILPATLALHLGLPQLVDRHLDLGRAPGRANTGDKMMTLVILAGGDCIEADVLRTGGTACGVVWSGHLPAPSRLLAIKALVVAGLASHRPRSPLLAVAAGTVGPGCAAAKVGFVCSPGQPLWMSASPCHGDKVVPDHPVSPLPAR